MPKKSPKKPQHLDPSADNYHTSGSSHGRRAFLLGLTALGAFIVGRSTHLNLSQSEYLRGITTADFMGAANSTNILDSYGTLVSAQPPMLPLLKDAPYTINDRTMRLSPYVDRLWLHNGVIMPKGNEPKPKVKLILTEMGWNQPNVEKGLEFVRSLRLREIMQAVIDHPLFDPTFSWNDMVSGKLEIDPDIQYFVFMDVETCFESNYPNYAGDFPPNADRAANRTVKRALHCTCLDINACHFIDQALAAPLFKKAPTARMFFFDCRGFGPDVNFRRERQKTPQLSIVSISSEPKQLLGASDMGQPPPAVNPIRLTYQERQEIRETCDQEKRKYLLSCVGAVRNDIRKNLFELHDEAKGVILMQSPHFKEKFGSQLSYRDVLQQSLFAATPRGDNRFSYRFTEVLSAGAIPVIHSDGWVLPFRRELIDWAEECAVIIPENQVASTIDILQNITTEERCRRRRRCYEVYTEYMANAEGTVAGVIESATRAIQSAAAAAAAA